MACTLHFGRSDDFKSHEFWSPEGPGREKKRSASGWLAMKTSSLCKFFMYMGRVGETINTLRWFILDVTIEAKKRAWIDLLLEHLQPKTLNNPFILE